MKTITISALEAGWGVLNSFAYAVIGCQYHLGFGGKWIQNLPGLSYQVNTVIRLGVWESTEQHLPH
jgi:hypothetical protein